VGGRYEGSCGGCSVTVDDDTAERRLECTHCDTGGASEANDYAETLPSSIPLAQCGEGEWVGNQAGALTCEPAEHGEGEGEGEGEHEEL
jgi:hypothetical protein